jgi:hypothetical protein
MPLIQNGAVGVGRPPLLAAIAPMSHFYKKVVSSVPVANPHFAV